jgi:hypothetical protein
MKCYSNNCNSSWNWNVKVIADNDDSRISNFRLVWFSQNVFFEIFLFSRAIMFARLKFVQVQYSIPQQL